MAIWCWAILLPIPREPECTSTHTKPSESSLTSAKWLPDPSVPNWARIRSLSFIEGQPRHLTNSCSGGCASLW